VRFKSKDDADKALSQADEAGKLSISEVPAEIKRLEGGVM
jgi:hypothetical protein